MHTDGTWSLDGGMGVHASDIPWSFMRLTGFQENTGFLNPLSHHAGVVNSPQLPLLIPPGRVNCQLAILSSIPGGKCENPTAGHR